MLPGPGELALILTIVVIVFGAKGMPEIMEGVGRGIKDFRRAVDANEAARGITAAAYVRASDRKNPFA